jgi:hypothetical protein
MLNNSTMCPIASVLSLATLMIINTYSAMCDYDSWQHICNRSFYEKNDEKTGITRRNHPRLERIGTRECGWWKFLLQMGSVVRLRHRASSHRILRSISGREVRYSIPSTHI